LAKRPSAGRGNCHGSGRRRGDGDQTNSWGKWKSNAKAVNAVTTSGGIRKFKGKWSMMCKSCGWNTTHTTKFHDSYVKDPALFSLLAGVVHANVGQKLVICDVLQVLPCLKTKINMLILGDATKFRNGLFNRFSLSYPSPAIVQ
jgi:hypothetical protein